jgi:hypothetical protein
MQISIILCDFASPHPDGTFSLLRGGIDRVTCRSGGPLVFHGTLLVHIRPDLDDYGKEFGWSVSMVNADGAASCPPDTGVMNFPSGAGAGAGSGAGEKKIHSFNIVSVFNVVFSKIGRYEIRLRINGEQKAVWPLEVFHDPGAQQSQVQGSFEPVKPWSPSSPG